MKYIDKAVKIFKKSNLYPHNLIVQSPHKPHIKVDNQTMILFASNNYLGMTTDKRVIKEAIKGCKKWGIGNGSARLLTGNLNIHLELEEEIANFKNREAALTFVAGYLVNEGCIPAITNIPDISLFKKNNINKETVIFSDELNHASIISGIKLSKSKTEIYLHNNMDDLEQKLKKYSTKKRKIIITDSVFSMDGDIVNLPDLITLAKKYNSMVYLDDAHGTGILGPNGRGVEDYYNMEGQSDFVMGTFTKAFGGVGGFITSSQNAIDYLISARSFIFTAPIAPPIVTGLIKSIQLVKKETWRRKKLLKNSEYLRSKFKEIGLNTLNSQTQIIPVHIGNEDKANKIKNYLIKNKIFAPIATWPAVKKGMARIRFALMSYHTKPQMDYLIDIMIKIKKKYNI